MIPHSAIHAPAVRQLDLDHLAAAISQVEGGRPNVLGGRSCISETTWKQHTAISYNLSRYPHFYLHVEADHLRWIIDRLNHAGIVVAPDTVYCCWRNGVTGGLRLIRAGQIPECCERVTNIYWAWPA